MTSFLLHVFYLNLCTSFPLDGSQSAFFKMADEKQVMSIILFNVYAYLFFMTAD